MNSYRHRYRHRTKSPRNRDDREVQSRLLDHLLHCASDIILFHNLCILHYKYFMQNRNPIPTLHRFCLQNYYIFFTYEQFQLLNLPNRPYFDW